MEDTAILELYWRRDPEAIEQTAAKYGGYCRAIARNLLGCEQDREECLNDTWLHAWQAIPPARPNWLGGFVGKITRNLCLSRLRELGAKKRGSGEALLALDELSECVAAPGRVEQLYEARELAEAVNRFLGSLPQAERDLFLARYYFAAPIGALSERTGFSQAKVKSMLHRTRGKLRRYLTEEGLL